MSKPTPPLRLMLDIQAWQEETLALTAAERGALLALKMYFWRSGPLPNRDHALAQIVGMDLKDWRQARKSIEPLFAVSEGEWLRTDWSEELEDAYERINKAKERSQKGNDARWAHRRMGESTHPVRTPSRNPVRTPSTIPARIAARILNNKGGDFAPCAPIPSQSGEGFGDDFEADVSTAESDLGIRGAA